MQKPFSLLFAHVLPPAIDCVAAIALKLFHAEIFYEIFHYSFGIPSR